MKKSAALLLCVLAALTVTSCGAAAQPKQEPAAETAAAPATIPTAEPTPTPEPTPIPKPYEGPTGDYQQLEYADEETGQTIPYNLYLPEGYDGSQAYPLVVFVADAGANSDDVTSVLSEDGASVWVTPEAQEKHPCIVLVPQYTKQLVNTIGMMTEDNYQWTTGLTLATNLIFHVIDEYNVDESRVYGTGQSQGGMMTIAISDKYPDLYAAQYLVACQWDVEEMSAMKDDKLWIVVCEGDLKAYPGMNAAVENWESLGVPVVKYTAMWDSSAGPEELDALVAGMAAQDGDIHYTVFAGGNHTYTWTFAYDIEGIRDWLFSQSK